MDYCGPHGIALSDFLRWDDLSRDAAMAWQARRSATCGGCGTVKADWLTATDDDGNPVADDAHPAFLAVEDWCPGCDARARHERAVSDDRGDGMRTAFTRNDPLPASEPDPTT